LRAIGFHKVGWIAAVMYDNRKVRQLQQLPGEFVGGHGTINSRKSSINRKPERKALSGHAKGGVMPASDRSGLVPFKGSI
jgi:hypothetical protein